MRVPRRLARFLVILRRAFVSAYQDNVFGIAKGAAYSALLAFFPVLTTLTAVLVQANAETVSRTMAAWVFQVVPPGTEEIVRYNFTQRGTRPLVLLIVAVCLSGLAASGLMLSLMEGFRAAYRIRQGRPFFKERAMAFLLVFSAAIPVVLASSLMVFGNRTEVLILDSLQLLPQGNVLRGTVLWIMGVARYLLALGGIALGLAALYRLGPNCRQTHSVWPGALLATLLWWLATQLFAWYVRNIANYNVLYGSIGAVIALLVWMYLLSVIALFGCEFNAERERSA